MIVSIQHEQGTNPVVNEAVLAAMDLKIKTSLVFSMVKFNVDAFEEFLRCMLRAFAFCSKISCGWAMRKSYEILVDLPDGRRYRCFLRFDEDKKGITYGSLCEYDER